jgi:hypothetical protein
VEPGLPRPCTLRRLMPPEAWPDIHIDDFAFP